VTRSLVGVDGVFDRQRMKPELIGDQRQFVGVGCNEVDPDHAARFLEVRACQVNGVTDLFVRQFRPADRRPSKVISKAFNAAFHRLDQRLRPRPVGSKLIVVR